MPAQISRSQNSSQQSWFAGVEKAREKAARLLRQRIAVDQSTSIIVGELEAVDVDRLWQFQYPYCKLSMNNPVRFRLDGKFDHKMGEAEVFFVNKPEMVMNMSELSQKHPRIHQEAHMRIKAGKW